MTQAEGEAKLEETLYENRFLNLYQISKMGAKVKLEGTIAYKTRKTKIYLTEFSSIDLIAGASLVLAALIAEGKTIINSADYILRGYEDITEKLTNLGAKIKLIQI